jgi:RHH-type proline utilization regulon transcriptional repressor/proline dehydrogenase/delta 1-pyrroline-5-carboxylate dehydrogenase
VRDILASAFQSAGQRCSALRMLYVQRDVSDNLLRMLSGAMQALQVGDPLRVSTDVGPLIDDDAMQSIGDYCEKMIADGRLIERLEAPESGRFVAPHLFRVSGIEELEREIFGPVLHVATFEADEIDGVIGAINARGYGLTFGLHTRIDARVQYIMDRMRVGNFYVNRNQIGAVVGAQPFGGEGLSGSGPKAGGPHYLARFRKPPGADADAAPARAVSAVAAPEIDAKTLPNPADGKWSTRPDRIAVLRKVLRGRASQAVGATAALDFGPVDLPGPTGEANALALYPRGRALCLGRDAETLLAQAVQALAAGNAVVAIAPGASSALAVLLGKDMPVAAFDGMPDERQLKELPFDVAALVADDETLRATRLALAARQGPIIRLVTDQTDPEAYVIERATCVDTTAAGGNASLLASA